MNKTLQYERFEELKLCSTCKGTYINRLCVKCNNKDKYIEKKEPQYLESIYELQDKNLLEKI